MTLSFDRWLPGVTSYTPTRTPPRLVRVTADFAGGGALHGALTHFGAKFAGSGTLTARITSAYPQLSGVGTFAAVGWVGQDTVPGYLTGDGELTARAAPVGV